MTVSRVMNLVTRTVAATIVTAVAATCLASTGATNAAGHVRTDVTQAKTKEWKAPSTLDVTLATKEWKTESSGRTKEW